MNLSDFFLPSSSEPGVGWNEQLEVRETPVLRMPPHSAAKDVVSPSDDVVEVMAPTMTDHLHVSRSHHVGTTTQLERVHSREVKERREVLPRPSDISFYVGRNRAPFILSAHTLKHSTYFASLLERQRIPDPVVLDCDEATFQNMVLILRYGSFEALPKMSESELFRLKMELECYGIDVPAESQKPSSPSTSSSSQGARAHSQQPMTPKHGHHRSAVQHPTSVVDFPDLPAELKDASKLFLVARMDDIENGIRCECTGKDLHTFWALSFPYRHIFCTGCGRCPSSLSPRHLAEMFMAAAMHYSNENFAANKQRSERWSVGCDSTCSLKLLNAKPSCVCPCATTENCSDVELPAWAVSTYYSHAFCTRCGQAADERTLIFILLILRYGGVSKHSKPRRDYPAGASEGAVAQDSRNLASSPGSEILRHYKGARSM